MPHKEREKRLEYSNWYNKIRRDPVKYAQFLKENKEKREAKNILKQSKEYKEKKRIEHNAHCNGWYHEKVKCRAGIEWENAIDQGIESWHYVMRRYFTKGFRKLVYKNLISEASHYFDGMQHKDSARKVRKVMVAHNANEFANYY